MKLCLREYVLSTFEQLEAAIDRVSWNQTARRTLDLT